MPKRTREALEQDAKEGEGLQQEAKTGAGAPPSAEKEHKAAKRSRTNENGGPPTSARQLFAEEKEAVHQQPGAVASTAVGAPQVLFNSALASVATPSQKADHKKAKARSGAGRAGAAPLSARKLEDILPSSEEENIISKRSKSR